MDRVVRAGAARGACALVLIGLALAGCSDSHAGGPERAGSSGSGAGATGQPRAGRPSDAAPQPAQGGSTQPQPTKPTEPMAEPSSVYFNPRLEGERLVIDVKQAGMSQLYYLTCSDRFTLEKYVNGEYVPLRDDRPVPNVRPGYYLDGEFIAGGVDGCSVMECVRYPEDRIEVGPAYEFVQLGVMPAPGGDPSIPPVPVIERRPLSGMIRIAFTYFLDGMCQSLAGITMEYDVPGPEDGVCCPIGPAECSSPGPAGGWALNLEECPPLLMARDTLFVQQTDARGCPKLVAIAEHCCSTCGNDDAGL